MGLSERLAALKVGCRGRYAIDLNALASTYVVEVGEGETRDMTL